jgi:predicted PurR-regulated permease PerM
MKKDRRMFVLMFVSSFALVSVVGYVGIASAQNMSAGSNMTSNATKGNDTGIGTAKELENLTGSNMEQFNNSALANLTTDISQEMSNITGNNSALANLTTGISQKMSNITTNIVGNQTGNQSK